MDEAKTRVIKIVDVRMLSWFFPNLGTLIFCHVLRKRVHIASNDFELVDPIHSTPWQLILLGKHPTRNQTLLFVVRGSLEGHDFQSEVLDEI